MSKRRDKERGKKKKEKKGCGIDVHESVLVCVIMDQDDNVVQGKFQNEVSGHVELASWLVASECRTVGLEATGVYWKALVAYLRHKGFRVYVSNPEFVKGKPGQKTDKIDATRLAQYTRDGYMDESIVVDSELNDLRNLTRMRSRMVSERTRMKNRVSALISRCGIRLKLSDKFGKAGMAIMRDMAAGKPVAEVFSPTRCKSMGFNSTNEVLAHLDRLLTKATRCELRILLDAIRDADERVGLLENAIHQVATADEKIKRDVELAKSVPGFADVASWVAVAETGGFDKFPSSGKYSGYAGLVQEIHNSGEREVDGRSVEKVHLGRIRTRCNKRLKWIFMMAAETVANLSSDVAAPFKRFFQRMMKRHSGPHRVQQSLVALAHKLARTVYAVVKSGKPYVGDKNSTKTCWLRRRKKGSADDEGPEVMKEVCTLLCCEPGREESPVPRNKPPDPTVAAVT